jgi:hypothetical protein
MAPRAGLEPATDRLTDGSFSPENSHFLIGCHVKCHGTILKSTKNYGKKSIAPLLIFDV